MSDKRINNGAKSKGDAKKIGITIYKPIQEIEEVGGMSLARAILSRAWEYNKKNKSKQQ